MTETTLNSLIIAGFAALPPTIAALAALRQGKQNAVKAEQIHVLVNGSLHAVKAELAASNQRVVELHELVAKMMVSEAQGAVPAVAIPTEAKIEAALEVSKTADALARAAEVK